MIKVSHSQLQSFDRCNYAWHLSYEEGWVSKEPSPPLALGSFVHELLAIHYRNVANRDNTLELVDLHATNKYNECQGDPDLLQIVGRGLQIVRKYLADFAPAQDKGWHVLETEKHLSVELVTPNGHAYTLEGILDVLYTTPDGKLWLVDHKTVGHGKFWSDTEIMMDSQMPTYVAVLREKLGMEVFGITYNMLNTYEYKTKTPHQDQMFRRMHTYRTTEEVNNHLKNLGHAVDELITLRAQPVRRKSLKRECCYCQFQEVCLAEMKGMDPIDILNTKFKPKEELVLTVPTVTNPLTAESLFGTI